MQKLAIILLLIIIPAFSFSQVAENKYRLYLTDKNNNEYSIDYPEEFLSSKAITRRENQNIDLQINDLPVSQYYIDSLKNLGFEILNKSKWLNTVVVYSTDNELIDTITKYSFIKSKEKSTCGLKANSHRKCLVRNNQSFILKKDDPYDYGDATSQISMLNGHVLHQNGYKGQGITIAVLDGGFYNTDILPAFDSLWQNNQILGTKDFVCGDDQVFDASSHGMKVLSTMGSNIAGELVGTAPKANYWLLRSENTVSEYAIELDNWIAAAEFADSVGADIINSSLGYTEFDDNSQNFSYEDLDGNTTFITRAADIAASKGILVVNSAGNLADDPWTYISAPADGDSVLTVGAVDSYAAYVSFSGIGPTADGRIKPNVAAMGYQTAVQGTTGDITVANGTSFSAPIISGMAACLWQYYPDFNNMEIIKKIEESAHQYSNPDYLLGYGIPDFGKAADLTGIDIISIFNNEAFVRTYPNPFYSNIIIEILIKTTDIIEVELFSLVGRKLRSLKASPDYFNTQIEITNLDNLPPGIYLLKIRINNQDIFRKISKIE